MAKTIKSRFEKAIMASKLGCLRNFCGYSQIEVFGFIHDPKKIYFRCFGPLEQISWKFTANFEKLNVAIDGFVYPKVKNEINHFMRYSHHLCNLSSGDGSPHHPSGKFFE